MSLLLLIHHAAFLFSSMDDNSGFEAPDLKPRIAVLPESSAALMKKRIGYRAKQFLREPSRARSGGFLCQNEKWGQ
jgi:hypothetical protein